MRFLCDDEKIGPTLRLVPLRFQADVQTRALVRPPLVLFMESSSLWKVLWANDAVGERRDFGSSPEGVIKTDKLGLNAFALSFDPESQIGEVALRPSEWCQKRKKPLHYRDLIF